MTYDDFSTNVSSRPAPVILIEGKRNIPTEYAEKAMQLTEKLAKEFPALIFRSGNAEGADQAFTEGVKRIYPSRIQIIAPYRGHRKKEMITGAKYLYPEDLSIIEEDEVIYQTIQATPKNESMIRNRQKNSTLAAKSKYLVRDTMKVVGYTEAFTKPAAAIFYVNLDDIESGGTGHTIRVCRNYNIPCIFQNEWEKWL